MATQTPMTATEQAAGLILLVHPDITEVTFHDDGPPTVRSMCIDGQPGEDVVATSPEHLVRLLQEARACRRRMLEQWISESYSRTKA